MDNTQITIYDFFSHFILNISERKNASFNNQTSSFNASTISNSLLTSRPQLQQPIIRNESFHSQYEQHGYLQPTHQVEQKSVRTSAQILPDQGYVPLMMPAVSSNFSTSKSFQSFQKFTPAQQTFASSKTITTSPTARSRSYEHSQTGVSYSRQVPVLHQNSPLKVDTGSVKDLYSSSKENSASPTYLERFHSPTKRSNYSFERYQQSIGVVNPGTQFKPFETRGDSFASKFKKFDKSNKETYYNAIEHQQQQPDSDSRTFHRTTDLAEQEFIFRPSTGTGLSIQTTALTSPRKAQVEATVSPQYKSYLNTETQQEQMYRYEPARIELVRRLPPVVRTREDGMVKLELEVSGGNDIQVSWYKNGVPMRDSPQTRIVNNGFGLHSLIIPQLFGEDSGLYKVLITSPLSGQQLESYCQLIVEGFYLQTSSSFFIYDVSHFYRSSFFYSSYTKNAAKYPRNILLLFSVIVTCLSLLLSI